MWLLTRQAWLKAITPPSKKVLFQKKFFHLKKGGLLTQFDYTSPSFRTTFQTKVPSDACILTYLDSIHTRAKSFLKLHNCHKKTRKQNATSEIGQHRQHAYRLQGHLNFQRRLISLYICLNTKDQLHRITLFLQMFVYDNEKIFDTYKQLCHNKADLAFFK